MKYDIDDNGSVSNAVAFGSGGSDGFGMDCAGNPAAQHNRTGCLPVDRGRATPSTPGAEATTSPRP